jgi:hypothetical protein
MKSKVRHFLVPLVNVDETILPVILLPECTIEQWRYERLVQMLSDMDDLPEHEIQFILDSSFCASPGQDYGYVVTGTIEIPDAWDKEKGNVVLHSAKTMDAFKRRFENKIGLMRLFKEGHIAALSYYSFRYDSKFITPEYVIKPSAPVLEALYTVSLNELTALNFFLASYEPPFAFPYLQLAYENFNESYDTHNENLAFLSLMIAVEILFNTGPHNLRYRLSRGLAVLIGKDRDEAGEIFRCMKKLYDKRSSLVHTGRVKGLGCEEINQLRKYLRRAIRKLLEFEITKEDLSERLTIAGFGQSIDSLFD